MKILFVSLMLPIITCNIYSVIPQLYAQKPDMFLDPSQVISPDQDKNNDSSSATIKPQPNSNIDVSQSNIYCKSGRDGDCYGTHQDDKIQGSFDYDNVIAKDGDDIILGAEEHDRLFGNNGDDIIYGEQGNDFLAGNDGEDQLYGGEGDDFVFAGEINHDTKKITNWTEEHIAKDYIDCGPGWDRVWIDNLDVQQNCEVINDYVNGVKIDPVPVENINVTDSRQLLQSSQNEGSRSEDISNNNDFTENDDANAEANGVNDRTKDNLATSNTDDDEDTGSSSDDDSDDDQSDDNFENSNNGNDNNDK